MLVAVEGPDCAGKTTLWNKLRERIHAHFVPSLSPSLALMSFAPELELRDLAFWKAVYCENALYVCDRHVSVSSQVYAALYNRKAPDIGAWRSQAHVLYLRPSIDILLSRMADERIAKPCDVARTVALYDAVTRQFHCEVATDGEEAIEAFARLTGSDTSSHSALRMPHRAS